MPFTIPMPLKRLVSIVFAFSLVAAPLLTGWLVYNAPPGGGAEQIATVASNLPSAQVTLVLGVIASLLSPFSILALIWLALPRAPWLAILGGGIALIGWLSLMPFEVQSAMTYAMARLGNPTAYVPLWDQVNNGVVMSIYTVLFIFGHMIATLLLGIALSRSRVIPAWALIAYILFLPLQAARFVVGAPLFVLIAYIMLALGNGAAAWVLLRGGRRSPVPAPSLSVSSVPVSH